MVRYSDDLPLLSILVRQGQSEKLTRWNRLTYKEYLAFVYTLFGSSMAVVTILISGYQKFVSDKSMLKKLYGENKIQNHKSNTSDNSSHVKTPNEIFQEKLMERQEFKVRYCCFRFITIFKAVCCCLVPCCSRSKGCFRR